jgi:alpha-beta hydrolase superfamily lysophospholipase
MRMALAQWIRLTGVLALLGMALAMLRMPAYAAAPADHVPTPPASHHSPASCEPDRVQASGAIYRICMPTFPPWNGDLVVYAHGYVSPDRPVGIPEEQLRLPGGVPVADMVNLLGYAFATTSYSTNGLAVRQGLADLVDLVRIFKIGHPTLKRVYLLGASEGGLITTLAVEQYPAVFSSGLALCGPVGDFGAQVNYVGDFRVVFDYFFPNLMPGSPISVPQSLMDTWDTHYPANILPAILDPANAITVTQLLSVTQAAYDPLNPTSISTTIHSALWYSVFATNDAIIRLGGQPFDNQGRVYTGSADDTRLNARVQRFRADQVALNEIQAYYQTAGRPLVPLVTMHTTLDQVVPYWHETLYRARVVAHGRTARHDNLPVVRYGHCNFTATEVQQALTLLLERTANPPRFTLFLPLVLR